MGGYAALAFAPATAARLAALVLADTRAARRQRRDARRRATARWRRIAAPAPAAYLDGSLPRLLSPDAPAGAGRAPARAAPRRAPPACVAGIEALRDRPDRTAELGADRAARRWSSAAATIR